MGYIGSCNKLCGPLEWKIFGWPLHGHGGLHTLHVRLRTNEQEVEGAARRVRRHPDHLGDLGHLRHGQLHFVAGERTINLGRFVHRHFFVLTMNDTLKTRFLGTLRYLIIAGTLSVICHDGFCR